MISPKRENQESEQLALPEVLYKTKEDLPATWERDKRRYKDSNHYRLGKTTVWILTDHRLVIWTTSERGAVRLAIQNGQIVHTIYFLTE